jgi:hypothetical protein
MVFTAFVVFLLAAIPNKVAPAEEQPAYDPATMVDVLAVVTDIREIPRGSPLAGIHLILKEESGVLDAYLGPKDFVKQFEITFAKGDEVQVIGSKVKTAGGAYVVLAREVRKGETTLYCRRKKGEPNWE